MTTFGLVHGAWHGAWCWERVIPALQARGHRAVAVDLPCDDPAAGAVRYAEIVDAALPRTDELVLVGHSLGGLTIPLVPAHRPVAQLVFLGAVVPTFGKSLTEQIAADPSLYARGYAAHPGRIGQPDGSTSWTPAGAREVFYHDCAPADAAWAVARLRPQSAAPRTEVCPLTAWPAVPRASILCRDDRAVDADWSRRVARERLGVEAIELPGGHSPFLSRPAELAACLDALVRSLSE